MERDIIGIVIGMSLVQRSSADIDDIITLELKLDILHTGFQMIPVAEIIQIRDNIPLHQILGYHQRQIVSGERLLVIGDGRSDGVISLADSIIADGELGTVCVELH